MCEYARNREVIKMPASEAEAGSLIASQLDNWRRERNPVSNYRTPRLKPECTGHRE